MSVVEYVQPDQRVVSDRAPVPVFDLPTPDAPLPEHRVFYRTRKSRLFFAFTIVRWRDGSYRAYIREQPGYGGRSETGHATHRNGDHIRRPYVCWTPSPRKAIDILKVAREWAELTERYIETGRPIA